MRFSQLLEGLALIAGGLSFIGRNLEDEKGQGRRRPRGLSDFSDSGAQLEDSIGRIVGRTKYEMGRTPVTKTRIKPTNMDERVNLLIAMIRKYREDPRIREIAAKVLSRKCSGRWCVPEKNWVAEVNAIFGFVRENVRYTRDIVSNDTYYSPKRTLGQFKIGDCDDYSSLLGSLLQSVGYPLKVRIIQTTGNNDYNHVYLLVGMPPHAPKDWLPADASMPWRFGDQAPQQMVIRWKDYMVPN